MTIEPERLEPLDQPTVTVTTWTGAPAPAPERADLHFMITSPRQDVVLVRWLERLAKPGTGLYRMLSEEIEELDGVESVVMNRYSAVITVASHVRSEWTVAEEIAELIEHDEAIREEFFRRFGGFAEVEIVYDVVVSLG